MNNQSLAVASFEAEVLPRIEKAMISFRTNDNALLKMQANERSITHRLAVYLEQSFGSWYDVDCEYNRLGIDGEIKVLHLSEEEFNGLYKELQASLQSRRSGSSPKDRLLSDDGLTVFPDIVVHKRGADTDNQLVIEAKKVGDALPLDKLKLKLFTEKLHYKYGLFIKFGNYNESIKMTLWLNGKESLENYLFDEEGHGQKEQP